MKRLVSALAAASVLLMGAAQGAAIHPPKAMTVIPEKAFMGSKNVRKLVLHENIERIESMAFADTGIESLYALDVSGVEIAPDAFDGKTLFLFPMTTDTLTIARGDKFTLQYSSVPQNLRGGGRIFVTKSLRCEGQLRRRGFRYSERHDGDHPAG